MTGGRTADMPGMGVVPSEWEVAMDTGKLKFGMPTLIETESPEDAMKLCSELGLDFVELNMNLPHYQAEGLENTAYLKSLQQKYQVGYTIHLDENLNVCDFNQAVAAAYTKTVERALSSCWKAGCSA